MASVSHCFCYDTSQHPSFCLEHPGTRPQSMRERNLDVRIVRAGEHVCIPRLTVMDQAIPRPRVWVLITTSTSNAFVRYLRASVC